MQCNDNDNENNNNDVNEDDMIDLPVRVSNLDV
jgi:hypothetical protein